ncbi:lytic transglycosylase domain-containing protein [Listeria ilorinensis]|uniref:lytic transglycosylase domain-containing protein n=1 Tax=Listeria ilorinensis TaxID=2867439 RepID=UPI001EF4D46F|nr:lytic transglycosylase domain-containing protein [Listeria ilorinensis]
MKKVKLKKRSAVLIVASLISLVVAVIALILIMQTTTEKETQKYETSIPADYIPIYQKAAEQYQISWFLLAAVHRVETKFSTAEPMISKAGAIGPMQFMPCSFVGWQEKSCPLTNGIGDIAEKDLTDPAYIKKHGGYGVDANGDGKADPWDLEDAVFSTANFLADNGAKDGQEEKAIFAYNHSKKYVQDIIAYKNKFQKEWQKAH